MDFDILMNTTLEVQQVEREIKKYFMFTRRKCWSVEAVKERKKEGRSEVKISYCSKSTINGVLGESMQFFLFLFHHMFLYVHVQQPWTAMQW